MKQKQLTYSGHCVIVGLFLRICPVDDDIAAEDLDTSSAETSFGQRSGLVRVILEETKATILPPIIR
jgi:hypothetical protein